MPCFQFPCSLVAQFPENVYKNAGVSDILPLVMRSLDPDKISCMQFLRAGKLRLTFQDAEACSAVLKDGLDLDFLVQLLPADDRIRVVHLRDLPVEVDDDSVSAFLSDYGEVLSVDHCHFESYPSVRNGNRIIKMLLTQDIPYLFSWRNLEMSSDLLFRIRSGFAVMIISFSVKHRSHRLEMLL